MSFGVTVQIIFWKVASVILVLLQGNFFGPCHSFQHLITLHLVGFVSLTSSYIPFAVAQLWISQSLTTKKVLPD